MRRSIVLLLMMLFWFTPAFAGSLIGDKQAVMAILGEAENQSLDGMIAVGEVIRTRGSLKGIYGYRNVQKRYVKIPNRLKQKALYAWRMSAHTCLAHNATNWENVSSFGWPYWAQKMTVVATIGDHVFLK